MSTQWIRAVAAVMVFALPTLAAPAQAADVVYVENVTAAAEVTISTCPWEPIFEVRIVCTDTYLLYFQARRMGSTGPPEPWSVFIHETTWLSDGEGEFELTGERFGFGPAAAGYVDAQHLRSAAVRATIPMSEGHSVAVDLRWELTDGDVQVSGNHGPIEGFSWGRRGRDGCSVQNWLAHQRWRWDFQGVSGTLGGVDVADLHLPIDWPAVFIEGRSTFQIIINQTGADCVPT